MADRPDAFIRRIAIDWPDNAPTYPFSIPAVQMIESIDFSSQVTFLVGENGSGKSTLVEAIAVAAGFSAEGGTKNYSYSTIDSTSPLADNMTLIRGARRETYGYFLRAESFYTTANYAETGTWGPLWFDGKRIHEHSHGEAFLAIAKEFRPGLFIFDEPESALSPQRQLALMAAIYDLVKKGSQFIIATHSPILLAYPDATIYSLSEAGIQRAEHDELEHVTLTKDFLEDPDKFLRHLFQD